MKKENIKMGDIYELNGNTVVITKILDNMGGTVYSAEAYFDEDGNYIGYDESTENAMTDSEIKYLK